MVGQDGGKEGWEESFKDYRKPGNKELGWEMQGQGEDKLPSRFSSSKQDAVGQEAALSSKYRWPQKWSDSDPSPSDLLSSPIKPPPLLEQS